MIKKATSIIVVLLCLVIVSCDKKRDHIATNTFTLSIDPAKSAAMATGQSLSLKAVCRNSRFDEVDVVPVWSMDTSLGTLSTASGKNTVFTAGQTASTGKIYVAYKELTASINVTVSGSGGTLGYVLLSDTQGSSDLTKDSGGNIIFNYFDTNDLAPWQITTQDASPGSPVDFSKCMEVSYLNNVANGWGGFFLEFNAAKDLSAYTKLTFYAKGVTGSEKFLIKISDGSDKQATINTLTTSWQKIELPLSGFTGLNTAAITKPFIIAFTDGLTGQDATVYLDYIGFE